MPLKKAERKEKYSEIIELMLKGKNKEAFNKLALTCGEDTGLFFIVDYDKVMASIGSEPKQAQSLSDKYFLNDPENGFETFATKELCEKSAEDSIQNYLGDGWDESVVNVVMGVITHEATQFDREERPDDVNEDGDDGNGEFWAEEWAYKCNYKMMPLTNTSTE